jgi:hypothetical protein
MKLATLFEIVWLSLLWLLIIMQNVVWLLSLWQK